LAGEQEYRVFWLNGLAGTGKSTIAQTFAERAFADGKLGASFFCSRDFADRSNLQAIFPTLAFQLAYKYQPFREKLLPVLKACPDVAQESLCSQMEKLIVNPLKASHTPTLIIIDALDECKDEEPASAILSILSRYTNEIPSVKFFITGRPEPRIRSGFRLKALLPITDVLKLHEVKPETVNNDIKLFFRTRLTELAKERSDCKLAKNWPSSSDVRFLCKKAAGFFIYAATVVKFIMSKNRIPTQQLNLITSLPQSTSHEGRSGIDILYAQVLGQALDDVDMDDEKFHSHFRTVVGAVVLVFNPLSVEALSDLLKVSGISTTLRSLHSLLLVPTSEVAPVRVFHKSFPDFLTDQNRCTDHQFFIDPKIHHVEIFLSCLNLMLERLKRNICRLDDHAILSEVEDLTHRRKDCIGDTLGYACCFWAKHLVGIPGSGPGVGEIQETIEKFFTSCLLSWMEALSLMGKLDLGVHALESIQQWYTLVSWVWYLIWKLIFTPVQVGVPCKWANDSQRLLLEWFDVICISPSEVYHLALQFCPPSSWLCKSYSTELSQEVKVIKGVPAKWGECSRTVTLDKPPSAFTCWKGTIAVGLESGDIIILDGITGTQTAVLPEHTDFVTSLAFSSDGISIVSGSDDRTIKLWDVQTGGVIKTFEGHTNHVVSVSISADYTIIASGSMDGTIRLWGIQTEECHHVIKKENLAHYVKFSPTNPQHFMSVSGGEVLGWDINGHQINPTHNGTDIAFSPDGTQLVSCQGEDIVIWYCGSGEIITKFHMANSRTGRCCFSPDARLIAVAAKNVVYVYDVTSVDSHSIKTFVGHTGSITSLAFSSVSSLISSSNDGSVKFWQIDTLPTSPIATDLTSTPLVSSLVNQLDPTVTNSKSSPLIPTPIMSVTLQAAHGIVISSGLDKVVRTWDILTGLCKASFQIPAKDPRWSDARLVNSRLIFVWHVDREISIWDVEKRELLQTMDTPKSGVYSIKISGDGSKVFSLSVGFISAWSILTGEVVGEVGHESFGHGSSFTVDGSRIWVYSPQSEPLGWDFGIIGSPPVQLSRTHLLHPSNTKYWDVSQSRVRDIATGKVIFQLAGRFANPSDSQWDGQYLVVGYWSGEMLILDFNHMLH